MLRDRSSNFKVPASSFTKNVTLEKTPNLLETSFPHLQNESDDTSRPRWVEEEEEEGD